MKDFDLDAAKRGATVCTRDGREARILCFKCEVGPILAEVEDEMNGYSIVSLYEDGIFDKSDGGRTSTYDLFMADDDYLEKLDRGEYDHIEDNLEKVGNPDHIGEYTEKVDWDYWRRMYAGMAMQGFCRENVTMNPASMVANVSVEYADALIAELKKTK